MTGCQGERVDVSGRREEGPVSTPTPSASVAVPAPSPKALPRALDVLRKRSNKGTLYSQHGDEASLESLSVGLTFSSEGRCSATATREEEGRPVAWISLRILKRLPSSTGDELLAVCQRGVIAGASYYAQGPVVLRHDASSGVWVDTEATVIGPLATHCPSFKSRYEASVVYEGGDPETAHVEGLCSDE